LKGKSKNRLEKRREGAGGGFCEGCAYLDSRELSLSSENQFYF